MVYAVWFRRHFSKKFMAYVRLMSAISEHAGESQTQRQDGKLPKWPLIEAYLIGRHRPCGAVCQCCLPAVSWIYFTKLMAFRYSREGGYFLNCVCNLERVYYGETMTMTMFMYGHQPVYVVDFVEPYCTPPCWLDLASESSHCDNRRGYDPGSAIVDKQSCQQNTWLLLLCIPAICGALIAVSLEF